MPDPPRDISGLGISNWYRGGGLQPEANGLVVGRIRLDGGQALIASAPAYSPTLVPDFSDFPQLSNDDIAYNPELYTVDGLLIGPAWSSVTTYATNAVVTHSGKLWKSSISSNLNREPGVDPSWLETKPLIPVHRTVGGPPVWGGEGGKTSPDAFIQGKWDDIYLQSAGQTITDTDWRPGPWFVTGVYPKDRIVEHEGVHWISKQNNNLGNTPSEGAWWTANFAAWSNVTHYAVGAIVVHEGRYWRSIATSLVIDDVTVLNVNQTPAEGQWWTEQRGGYVTDLLVQPPGLQRDIPSGLALTHTWGGTTWNVIGDHPAGSTTITVRENYGGNPGPQTYTTSHVFREIHGHLRTRGGPATRVERIYAHAAPRWSWENGNSTRDMKYCLDGINIRALGTEVNEVHVDGFPGWGVIINSNRAEYAKNGHSTGYDRGHMHGRDIWVYDCKGGIWITGNDNYIGNLYARGTDDVALYVTAPFVTGYGAWHPNGGKVALWQDDSEVSHGGQVYLDNTPVSGLITGSGSANSRYNAIYQYDASGIIRCGLIVDANRISCGSCRSRDFFGRYYANPVEEWYSPDFSDGSPPAHIDTYPAMGFDSSKLRIGYALTLMGGISHFSCQMLFLHTTEGNLPWSEFTNYSAGSVCLWMGYAWKAKSANTDSPPPDPASAWSNAHWNVTGWANRAGGLQSGTVATKTSSNHSIEGNIAVSSRAEAAIRFTGPHRNCRYNITVNGKIMFTSIHPTAWRMNEIRISGPAATPIEGPNGADWGTFGSPDLTELELAGLSSNGSVLELVVV